MHSGDETELYLGKLLRMYVCRNGWNSDHSLLACMNLIANKKKGVLSSLFPVHTVIPVCLPVLWNAFAQSSQTADLLQHRNTFMCVRIYCETFQNNFVK